MNKVDLSEIAFGARSSASAKSKPAISEHYQNTPQASASGGFDIAALTVLFLVAFSLWTIPAQDSRPFGEGDAAFHFSIGDYISSSDNPIYRLPFYIGQWYYNYNPALGINAPEYPPSNHYNYALMQVAGGERFAPVMIYRAIASFLGIFAVYFLMKKLFGTPAAIIAATGLVFSVRERLIYLWGQQPTLVSIVFAPVIFYAYYKYLDGYYKKENSLKYLYITAFLLCSQYLLHIQGVFLSVVTLGFFTLMMFLKHKKLPFVKSSWKQLAVIAAVVLLITLPFIMIYLGTPQGGNPRDFSRVFSWGVDHSLVAGSYSQDFINFSGTYPSLPIVGSMFSIALMLLGIAFLLLKRRNQDLLMLSWLAGIYVVLHADLLLGVSVERAARMLVAEPALFYSLIAIGATSLVAFVNIPKSTKILAKYGIAAVVVLIIVSGSASQARESLEVQYQSIFRLTPEQLALADWLRENTPENAYIYYMPETSGVKLGTWQYQKLRWLLASSQRHVASYAGQLAGNPDVSDSEFYAIFDYSDLAIILNSPPNPFQPAAQQSTPLLQQIETQNFNGTSPLYNNQNIRVYKIEAEIVK